jgi:hypothetical protein
VLSHRKVQAELASEVQAYSYKPGCCQALHPRFKL